MVKGEDASQASSSLDISGEMEPCVPVLLYEASLKQEPSTEG